MRVRGGGHPCTNPLLRVTGQFPRQAQPIFPQQVSPCCRGSEPPPHPLQWQTARPTHLSPGPCPPGQPHAHEPNHRPSQASGFVPRSDIPALSCLRKNSRGRSCRPCVLPSLFPSTFPVTPPYCLQTVGSLSPHLHGHRTCSHSLVPVCPCCPLSALPPSSTTTAPVYPPLPGRPGLKASLQCPLPCWGRRPTPRAPFCVPPASSVGSCHTEVG